MGLLDFLGSRKKEDIVMPLTTDVHSHLLPGIDDGAPDLEASVIMIRKFVDLGFERLITTPHILQDYYPNTPSIIRQKLSEVKNEISRLQIPIELDAAAEYYLDEFLLEKVKNNEELLTFGTNYLLFEMGFFAESPFVNDFIFQMRSRGIIPVIAHLERYPYYFNKPESITDLHERGALIQVNINSLTGHYGKPVQKAAEKLIDSGMVHLLGSDCHNPEHIDLLRYARGSKYYLKALHLQLINREV